MQGNPRWMGHRGEFWQKVVHCKRDWQTTPVLLLQEHNEQYEKAKRYDTRWRVCQAVQYATGKEWTAITNNLRKNEAVGPKQKWCSVVDVSGGESKVSCCEEQYCIGIWNIRPMSQGKLDMVKQEMARVNTDIWGISEIRWMEMGKFNLDDHYIYYCEQESLRRNGVALIVNKRVENAVLGCRLKNDRIISVCF